MRSMPSTPGRPRSVSTPTWNATASSSPTRPPSTASSTRSSPSTDTAAAAGPGTPDVRIGCSGWNYASWRAAVYPPPPPPPRPPPHHRSGGGGGTSPPGGAPSYPPRPPASRWLDPSARVFDTVEVNSTFYRLARRDAVARWVEQTSADFVFTIKSSQYLTHMKRLTDMERGVQRLYEPLQPLLDAGRMGPVLWQLPERFPRDHQAPAFP